MTSLGDTNGERSFQVDWADNRSCRRHNCKVGRMPIEAIDGGIVLEDCKDIVVLDDEVLD